jgi:hypothetical protein
MIASVLLFLLGIHLMMTLLAAGYRVIDLWYRLGDFWLGIAARILMSLAIIGLLIVLLPAEWQSAFIDGLVFYLGFHVLAYWLGRLVIWRLQKNQR